MADDYGSPDRTRRGSRTIHSVCSRIGAETIHPGFPGQSPVARWVLDVVGRFVVEKKPSR